jgi:osmotically-inducible protein OsmY
MRHIVLLLTCTAFSWACAQDLVQLEPFAQATAGDPRCPAVQARLVTREEAQTQAHARVERGTRCAMEGTCEPGGAYRRDPEVNDAVRAAIAADKRFANTSVYVTTSRKWVTLEGCVRSNAQRKALVGFVGKQPRVEKVFDSLRVR